MDRSTLLITFFGSYHVPSLRFDVVGIGLVDRWSPAHSISCDYVSIGSRGTSKSDQLWISDVVYNVFS